MNRTKTPMPSQIGPPRLMAKAGTSVVVIGGGIAGLAAATILAERGVRVSVIERERFLGGRAGGWTERLADGETFDMERGFHAFFRQYYNLRALLKRIDPTLGFLTRLDDYPILGPDGHVQSFAGIPKRTPHNIITLTIRARTLGLRDLIRVNARRALEMLAFDADKTYMRRDGMSAGEYLDSLRFPEDARRLLFDVFSHSFFNPEEEMSAAELLMMFHFYFTGNPEGLVFDVSRSPFATSIWKPLAKYLSGLGVTIRSGESARMIRRGESVGWRVVTTDSFIDSDGVIIATNVPGLQRIVTESTDLDDPAWRSSVATLSVTNRFAVWRLWLDQPTHRGRAPFAGTTGVGPLDNISLYHLFEDESRVWADRTGGAVVELHAYAIDNDMDETVLKAQLLDALHTFYNETKSARIVEDRFLMGQDCPAFAPGSYAERPGVDTPFAGLAIAGDLVKCPVPSALMERAATTGFLAANRLLGEMGVRPEPIASIPERGLLARMPLRL